MPAVCAIILDYFGSSKTIACLTSLIGQGLDAVMIVDNAGDRQANMQLQEALAEFSQREVTFTIHQIVNPQNLGYAAGVNNALRWLEENQPHRYYLLINNDAEATPGMLPELLKFMREHDRAALSAPVIDTGHKQLTGYWYHRFSGLMFAHRVIGAFPYLSGCCLLVDRRIIGDDVFDEDFFMYGEDIALCWRLRQSGWDTACVSQAIVRHEGTGSSRQGGIYYEYHLARMHILLARKLARRRWEIPFLYFGRLLTLSARAIVRAIRFRSLVPIKASLSALRRHNVSSA
jgi:N-acetylglucosaminyl-diphospho-decaprenol L-rhamnosyltransferase